MARVSPANRLTRLALFLFALIGCAHRPAVPELPTADSFTPAAAEYQTTYVPDAHAHDARGPKPQTRQVHWRLWREENRIVTENLGAHTGELWQRDGSAVFHQKIFHDDRRSIEYRNDDLALIGAGIDWSRRSLLIDPELLKRLNLRRAGWKGDVPYRRYVGESDGSQWDITIRTDLMLPTSIVRNHDGAREQTLLQNAYRLDNAPWSPTASADYEVIDFTDLGDRQSDPFVVKVQGQLGNAPHLH